MSDPRDYSQTAASNVDDAPEGMQAGGLNDAIRKVQADIASMIADTSGAEDTAGTSTAYTITLNTAPSALADGLFFMATIDETNTGASTLTVTPEGGSAFSSKKIKKICGGEERELTRGDMPAGLLAYFSYNSAADSATGAYILLNPEGPGWRLIERQTVSSAVASIDFTSGLDDTFDEYELRFTGLAPASNNVNVWLRIGTGAGPTWQTGSYSYSSAYTTEGGSVVGDGSLSAASIVLTPQGVGNTAGQHASGVVEFDNPDDTSLFFLCSFRTRAINSSDNTNATNGSGEFISTGAITGVRLMFSSGNIASCVSASLYGLAK